MKTIPVIVFCMSILFCMSITACVSRYQGQANALNQAYQNGQISPSDYHARMTELRTLDLQHRQATAQAFQQSSQDTANYFQQRANSYQPNYLPPLQPIQINPPTSRSGTIMTPGGQTYFYNQY